MYFGVDEYVYDQPNKDFDVDTFDQSNSLLLF